MSEHPERRPSPPRRGRNLPVVLAVLLGALPLDGIAQVVPVRPGQTIRVAPADSAALDLWRTGRVLAATRIGVLLSTEGTPRESVAVALSESVRLQLRRRSLRPMFIGGGVGLAAGVAVGATLLSSVFGASWGDEGPAAEMILFGLAGLGAGGITSHLLTRPHWVEIPLTARGLAPVALTRVPVRPGAFGRTERWEWFEANEEEFALFFAQWRDSLAALEGIWELHPAWNHQPARMAVVRDARYTGYEYIGIQLPPRGYPGRTRGLVTMAIRRSATPGVFEVRYTGSRAAGWTFPARLEDLSLRIEIQGGAVVEWILQLPSRR